jgi:predicted TPR repeat methyltransferase
LTDRSLPASYFDALYAADPDPWRFATSVYERDKYATTLRALPRRRYLSALEVGCSIGVLTHELAQRCDSLLSIDASARPLAAARERCRDRPSARFAEMTVPGQWPEEEFDLILLSEVVYYLGADDVAHLARRVEASLAPRGDVVLVHWTGATDYPLSGDDASEILLAELSGFASLARQRRTDRFRLDVFTRG